MIKTDRKLTLTENEVEVMGILWDQDSPPSRADILELSKERFKSPSSIHIILNKLLDKGAVEITGIKKTGTSYGRMYSPTIGRDEYYITQMLHAVQFISDKPAAVASVVSALIQSGDISLNIINELEECVQQRNEELV